VSARLPCGDRLVVQCAGDIVSIAFPNAAMSGCSPR